MTNDFKIHCILLTKNEADVVEDCLISAMKWADFIYVYDGESTDSTWEIVKSLASDRIVPWKQDGKVFKEGLRAEVFNEFRHLASEGDWWLQLNVDEFYDDDPREFFAQVPNWCDFVWGISVEYFITDKDIEAIDFTRPFREVKEDLHYYKVFWSEPRAFRYRAKLRWDTESAWPLHAGVTAQERIVFKHYPYRSPEQIQIRLDVRRDNRERGFDGWDHAKEFDWRSKLAIHTDCEFDDGFKDVSIQEDQLPRHIELPWRRCLKRILHGIGIWP